MVALWYVHSLVVLDWKARAVARWEADAAGAGLKEEVHVGFQGFVGRLRLFERRRRHQKSRRSEEKPCEITCVALT